MNRELWERELSRSLKGSFKIDEPMSRHTYYKIGGAADFIVIPESIQDLKVIFNLLKQDPIPKYFLGLGSNLLVSDAGFRGIVIKTQKCCQDWNPTEGRLTVGASIPNVTMLRKCADEGISGMEFLTGVPGSIGGAIFMNAGTTLGEVKDRLDSIDVFSFVSGQSVSLKPPYDYQYRKNLFLTENDLVLRATFRVSPEKPADVKARIQALLEKRKNSQPVDVPSCGSVFKNPLPRHAWEVIDSLGLRGRVQGGAQISEKHTNFIINRGHATAQDVKSLIDLVKTEALAKLGIKMEEEVWYLGF
ncbi:MAG: UDP-N-acetylmuramate dehydrogenase [Xanthomonadaceae bacterium]|nr:UDP-N-acetylmuramate dehydrogenase [Xanthomonadaceae bacterium]